MKKRYIIHVSGRVQGVYFRVSAKKQADLFELRGFVRNLSDGRVEIDAEGAIDDLKKLVEWCYQGSPFSKVTHVEVTTKDDLAHYDSFEITH